MQSVGDQFLTGAGFTANQNSGVGIGDLYDLFVNLTHGPGGSNDVGEFVSFLEFTQEMGILIHQSTALVVDQIVGLDGLRHHCRDDAEAAEVRVIGTICLEAKIHAQGANGPVADKEWNANESDVVLLEILALSGAIQKHGLPADLGDDS